ncbi:MULTISPECIES: Uma2 family endonuclease [Nostoc]|uniref:Uma2 family endonuclease n=1 Tax=Nostoc paludosum FACHB-159 TaxID=2692908 RepID=A0ABR8KAY4_9NOSO|nr:MULTISPECIES: Uma2 family endonuclease [Nostoc]MBD2679703.1 Uma2 family endonuclease [Nostoc sp. FACHB-857]MBD2736693.1 Uma2 family endonuclease [Nostoc paludosum FACHB-159]
MVLATVNTGSLNFETFVAGYLDDIRYELIDGELIDLEPTGLHEQVTGLINLKLNVAIDLLNLPSFVPMKCLIKPLGQNSAFRPDVVILDRTALANEPLWKAEPVITLGKSIKIVVEVVSTNWQNDYARKVEDYEALGIPEYWIADYLGLGGKRYIGLSKQPVVTIYQLVDGTYQEQQFRGRERLISQTFPNLNLTAEQIFAAGRLS